jgi:hypothetical protein
MIPIRFLPGIFKFNIPQECKEITLLKKKAKKEKTIKF